MPNPPSKWKPFCEKYIPNIVNHVLLFPDEEVEWHFTYINGEKFVSGYTIKKIKKS